MNIGVFCSQYKVAEKYSAVAERIGELIAMGKHTLIWGGSGEGLMGIVASAARKGGSKIIGVMYAELKTTELSGADEMHVVTNTYEMNLGIISRSDILIALPGGIGTLNELTEIIRMNKNGLHDKRVVFVNTDDFYDGFKLQLERMAAEGFLEKKVADSVLFSKTPDEAMEHLA